MNEDFRKFANLDLFFHDIHWSPSQKEVCELPSSTKFGLPNVDSDGFKRSPG